MNRTDSTLTPTGQTSNCSSNATTTKTGRWTPTGPPRCRSASTPRRSPLRGGTTKPPTNPCTWSTYANLGETPSRSQSPPVVVWVNTKNKKPKLWLFLQRLIICLWKFWNRHEIYFTSWCFLFFSPVPPVCAAAGPQAICAVRPPGAAEEETASCRALHHQEYESFLSLCVLGIHKYILITQAHICLGDTHQPVTPSSPSPSPTWNIFPSP